MRALRRFALLAAATALTAPAYAAPALMMPADPRLVNAMQSSHDCLTRTQLQKLDALPPSNIAAFYDGSEADRVQKLAWAEELAGAIRQSDDGVYVNFLADEGEARIRAAYPGGTYERLAEIKRRYDPDNLFRLNQNIPPA